MSDDDLREWWPDLGTVLAELRAGGRAELADRLVDAVRGGATSSEILGRLGLVMREQSAVRSTLAEPARRAWDAVMASIWRSAPGLWLPRWLAWLGGRSLSRR